VPPVQCSMVVVQVRARNETFVSSDHVGSILGGDGIVTGLIAWNVGNGGTPGYCQVPGLRLETWREPITVPRLLDLIKSGCEWFVSRSVVCSVFMCSSRSKYSLATIESRWQVVFYLVDVHEVRRRSFFLFGKRNRF